MIIDLHIHSTISPCSILPLEEILAHGLELGLECVCITDHDSMAATGRVREGRQPDGLVVLVGMEYSTPEGQFLIYGPFDKLPAGLGARELLALVDAQGGASVAAHPYRMIRPVADYLMRERLCHAIETMNGGNRHSENMEACEAAELYGLPGVGASDAHSLDALGRVASWSQVPIESRRDLVRAIREGLISSVAPCP